MSYRAAPPLHHLHVERMSLLAKLFIAVLLIVVLEGALRKWVSDGLTYPVVVLRDSLAAYGVLWALVKGRARYSPKAFQFLFLMTMALLLWGVLQVLVNQTSFLVYLIGLRFWLLYLWFAFFAGITFSGYDFKVISKVMVLLLIAMTPLAIMQHFLPSTSFWNKQVEEGGLIFTVSRDIVRTTGTFSFTMGYTVFLAMATPFAFMSLDSTVRLWEARWMPVTVIVALLSATIVSGSRGAIIFFGLMFMIYSLAAMRFAKGKKKAKSFLMIIAVITMLIASLSIFSRAVDATRERFESASQVESPVDRLIYTFAPQGELPFLGEGIGMGSNFAGVLQAGQRSFLLAESENARIILETGFLGIGIIVLKFFIIWRAGRTSFRAAKRTGSLSNLLIWVAVAMGLLSWPITGQLTVNALGYLLFGLGIAAFRFDRIRMLPCR